MKHSGKMTKSDFNPSTHLENFQQEKKGVGKLLLLFINCCVDSLIVGDWYVCLSFAMAKVAVMICHFPLGVYMASAITESWRWVEAKVVCWVGQPFVNTDGDPSMGKR